MVGGNVRCWPTAEIQERPSNDALRSRSSSILQCRPFLGRHSTQTSRTGGEAVARAPQIRLARAEGTLSDAFGLKLALTVAPVFALGAAVFFVLASRSYEADAVRSKTSGQFQ